LESLIAITSAKFALLTHEGMLKNGGVDLDQRGNVRATRMITSWRPIAGGVGDPRRPAVRAGDRSVSDGDDDAAAVTAAIAGLSPAVMAFRTTLERESRED
jgi:hypothetical protein